VPLVVVHKWRRGGGAGGTDFDAGIAYFTKLFLERNDMPGKRKIFTKATCATDRTNVKTVFNRCVDAVSAPTDWRDGAVTVHVVARVQLQGSDIGG
jgi:hypothetical protein